MSDERKPEPVCFLDMDGVLSDFVTAAHAIHKRPFAMADVRWKFNESLGFVNETAGDFWSPMGREFWANLDWTPEGRDLLRGVEKIFGPHNIALLTSPCETDGCRDGKVDWVRKHIPQYERRMMMGGDKFLVAGPMKVLVDDHDGNCDKFVLGGGNVVRVPRPWNEQRDRVWPDGSYDVRELLGQLISLHKRLK
jgi:hypothetical protein